MQLGDEQYDQRLMLNGTQKLASNGQEWLAPKNVGLGFAMTLAMLTNTRSPTRAAARVIYIYKHSLQCNVQRHTKL